MNQNEAENKVMQISKDFVIECCEKGFEVIDVKPIVWGVQVMIRKNGEFGHIRLFCNKKGDIKLDLSLFATLGILKEIILTRLDRDIENRKVKWPNLSHRKNNLRRREMKKVS